jgi:hypothetical protein
LHFHIATDPVFASIERDRRRRFGQSAPERGHSAPKAPRGALEQRHIPFSGERNRHDVPCHCGLRQRFLPSSTLVGVAVLFVIALGFFAAALVNLAREARIALNEVDHYQS